MKQLVEITMLADRHATRERHFAESFSLEVEAAQLTDVLDEVSREMSDPMFRDLGPGRYHIVIGEPYE